MNQKFETRYVTAAICKYQDRYLLLKISKDYPFCPGDWDFVFSRCYKPNESDEKNILSNVNTHIGLIGSIVKKGSVYVWQDDENKINWIIWPCVVEVDNDNVNLSKKYTKHKWVKREDILDYDRKNYFRELFKNIEI